MKGELLILFVILLIGLILCSFLGNTGYMEGMENNSNTDSTTVDSTSTDSSNNEVTNDSTTTSNHDSSNSYDNYNHYTGSSYPSIFYGPNGATAKIIKTPNDNHIVITNKNGTTEIYYIDSNTNQANISTYYGPDGSNAKIITTDSGKKGIKITTSTGTTVIYTDNGANASDNVDNTINQYESNNNTTGSDYNTAYDSSFTGGQTTTTVTGPNGNTYSTYDSSSYYNSLPKGIPRSQIPAGEEDLYILKSEVVPPVCPKCPAPIVQTCKKEESFKCPPCPPCARCPEPAFDCKKVPNYNAFNQSQLPMPVLNDFSTFGM